MAPLAFIIANLIIYWSGFEVLWKLGIVLVIGYVLIGISMAFDPQRPPLDWKSATWLPVYLIGMGIISWQGQYSGAVIDRRRCRRRTPATSRSGGTCSWWPGSAWLIYFWAMAARLPRREMLDLVNRQAGERTSCRRRHGTDQEHGHPQGQRRPSRIQSGERRG